MTKNYAYPKKEILLKVMALTRCTSLSMASRILRRTNLIAHEARISLPPHGTRLRMLYLTHPIEELEHHIKQVNNNAVKLPKKQTRTVILDQKVPLEVSLMASQFNQIDAQLSEIRTLLRQLVLALSNK